MVRYVSQLTGMVGQDRLFEEQQIEWLELAGKDFGHSFMDLSMKIDGNSKLASHSAADFGYTLDCLVDRWAGLHPVNFLGGIHFHGCESRASLSRAAATKSAGRSPPIQE